jgi:hypothetical protein
LETALDYERWKDGTWSICGRYPWLLHPYCKARILHEEAKMNMDQLYADAMVREMLGRAPVSPYLEMIVRRDHIVDDSLERLAELETRNNATKYLRKKLKVTFEGEQGLDEGGVTKEYFLLLVRQLFKPEYALVKWNDERTSCWFNSAALENSSEYRLVGMVIGLAIYNSTILDVHFPPIIYAYLLDSSYEPTFDDLKLAFPELASGLQQLLDYEGEVPEEEVFCLVFAVSEEAFGSTTTVPLVEGGDEQEVTRANKRDYVQRYTKYLLKDSVWSQVEAFCKGFDLVTQKEGFLQNVLSVELERIVCGYPHWNMSELEKVTAYEGGFSPETKLIQWFWDIVTNKLEIAQQHKLLSFVTGSDRVPVGGFQEMEFVIQRAGGDCEKLPTSHTCFNVLLLPEYDSYEKLFDKLKIAVNQCEGFGLV